VARPFTRRTWRRQTIEAGFANRAPRPGGHLHPPASEARACKRRGHRRLGLGPFEEAPDLAGHVFNLASQVVEL
jgi:hypothetical protein